MERIYSLRKDHQKILRFLIKIEKMLANESTNFSRLKRKYHRAIEFGEEHERRENELFNKMKQYHLLSKPIGRIFLQHEILRGHLKVLDEAIKSNDEDKIKLALENDGRMLISKIRQHIFEEEMLLDNIIFTYSQTISVLHLK